MLLVVLIIINNSALLNAGPLVQKEVCYPRSWSLEPCPLALLYKLVVIRFNVTSNFLRSQPKFVSQKGKYAWWEFCTLVVSNLPSLLEPGIETIILQLKIEVPWFHSFWKTHWLWKSRSLRRWYRYFQLKFTRSLLLAWYVFKITKQTIPWSEPKRENWSMQNIDKHAMLSILQIIQQ